MSWRYTDIDLLSMQWNCTNPFLKLINSFDRKLINFLLLLDEPIRFRFRTDWPIGNAQEVKRNLNSYELINLRKWIHAIFYQHFHCIDSNTDIFGISVYRTLSYCTHIRCTRSKLNDCTHILCAPSSLYSKYPSHVSKLYIKLNSIGIEILVYIYMRQSGSVPGSQGI
jgi:hypothetical protein